jgi:hypothetical protein
MMHILGFFSSGSAAEFFFCEINKKIDDAVFSEEALVIVQSLIYAFAFRLLLAPSLYLIRGTLFLFWFLNLLQLLFHTLGLLCAFSFSLAAAKRRDHRSIDRSLECR